MTTLRNRFFVEGILLGGLCGLVVGSLIAFQIGGERVTQVRRMVERAVFNPEPDRVLNLQ
jgi:hypothetical protein